MRISRELLLIGAIEGEVLSSSESEGSALWCVEGAEEEEEEKELDWVAAGMLEVAVDCEEMEDVVTEEEEDAGSVIVCVVIFADAVTDDVVAGVVWFGSSKYVLMDV